MSNVMDEAMRQAKEKWLEEQTLARYYKRMHFNNLVSRAEHMEERGEHLVNEFAVSLMETASATVRGLTPESRHRMSKEIAEELLAEKGAGAYFYCVEKLANDTKAPRLWRDVLSYLDEIGVKDGLPDREGRGEEQEGSTDVDS